MSSKDLVALILEFSRWVLLEDPDDGLRVFTHSHGRSGGISPDVVYQHLQRVADPECCILYLESLISHGEKAPSFHNELVYIYYEEVKKAMDRAKQARAGKGKKAKGRGANGTGRLGVLREKLINFLNRSDSYNAPKMLLLFPEDELLKERAILLRRTGQHVQALSIYAHKLNSPAMAEDYCKKNYNANTEDNRMYLHLLRVYLCKDLAQHGLGVQVSHKSTETNTEINTDTGTEAFSPPSPNIPAVLALLTNHYDKIDHAKALGMLPDDIPAAALTPFLMSVLRQNKHARRNNQVLVQLLRSQHLSVKLEEMELNSQRCVITSDSVCLSCGKRIGKAAFARLPNGRLMHYVCDIIRQEKA